MSCSSNDQPTDAPEPSAGNTGEMSNAGGVAPDRTDDTATSETSPGAPLEDAPDAEAAAPDPASPASLAPADSAAGSLGPGAPESPEAQLARAKGVKTRHEADLMDLPGVQGVGIGKTEDGRYALSVFFSPGEGADRAAIPTELEGIPVQVSETSPIRALKDQGRAAAPQ